MLINAVTIECPLISFPLISLTRLNRVGSMRLLGLTLFALFQGLYIFSLRDYRRFQNVSVLMIVCFELGFPTMNGDCLL